MKWMASKQFNRDLKFLQRFDRHIVKEVTEVIEMIVEGTPLPKEFRQHRLREQLSDFYECHIRTPLKGQKANERNDVLLIYQIRKKDLVCVAIRVGSHKELVSGSDQKGL